MLDVKAEEWKKIKKSGTVGRNNQFEEEVYDSRYKFLTYMGVAY